MTEQSKVYRIGDGTHMPRTGIWVRPETGEWGLIKPLSEKAKRIQALYDAERDE